MTAPRLELRNIGKAFGKLDVLADISLSANPGEFVSIVGASGAGKSTLFKLLIGELTPDAGELRFDGAPLTDNTTRFAFMPQRDALMSWRRVIDNLTLGLEVRGLGRKLARERVKPLLAEFGLEGFERHFPAQLSGGMRQRAALLRTVVQERDMLLLDEPLGALDALTRTGMQRWLETTWSLHRWTAALITHDVREAVFLSDRIFVLSARPGRVVREVQVPLPRPRSAGTPAAVAIENEILAILLNPDTGQRT
jgi:ABC-type nitrate/sulfonate/bicarbonate transport system ATPase subunit